MKIMLDTNILYSLFFLNSQFLAKWMQKMICDINVDLCWDDYSIEELVQIIYRKKSISREEMTRSIKLIETISFHEGIKIFYSANVQNIHKTRDENDDRILNSAISNGAEYLITRDKDLLEYPTKLISIVTPEQFMISYNYLN